MMESHIRVYIQENWNALSALSCSHYKVLIALVQRADPFGRCFPSAERIAEDTDLHIRTVYAALETLETCRYIGYLRRNECDPVTGRYLPNVYIVSPYFICIAEDNQLESIALWKSVFADVPMPRAFESKLHINQQQEPTSENQHNITNTRNQQQQPPFASESVENDEISQDANVLQKTKKANRETASPNPNENARNQQRGAPQRSQDSKSSANVKNYTNPDPIPAPLPDGTSEALAGRVNEYGLPMPLARGMVVAHGYEIVNAACNQLDATAKRQEIGNRGGFFRYILEKRLVDSGLPDVLRSSERKKYDIDEWIRARHINHEIE